MITLNAPVARNGGAAIRNCQTIRALAEFGPVDVVSLGVTQGGAVVGTDHQATWTFDELNRTRRRRERLRTKAWLARPGGHWRVDMYRSGEALRSVRALVNQAQPDLVVASQWQTGEYALAVAEGRRLVFDTHNVEADLRAEMAAAERGRLAPIASRVAPRRLRAWEARLGKVASQVWVCSDADARLWAAHYGADTPVKVVPNTVPSPNAPPVPRRHPHRMILTGSWSYQPNSDAARELSDVVLPLVRRRLPDAEAELVGREPTASMLASHDLASGVNVVGAVDDMAPRLAEATVMVVPLRAGGGTRLKLLEAMSAGLPVVTTPKGAEGLDIVPGTHALFASTPAELADAAVRVMTQPCLAASLADAGRRLVDESYSTAALGRLIASATEEMGLR